METSAVEPRSLRVDTVDMLKKPNISSRNRLKDLLHEPSVLKQYSVDGGIWDKEQNTYTIRRDDVTTEYHFNPFSHNGERIVFENNFRTETNASGRQIKVDVTRKADGTFRDKTVKDKIMEMTLGMRTTGVLNETLVNGVPKFSIKLKLYNKSLLSQMLSS